MIGEPGTKESELPNSTISLGCREDDLQCVRFGGIREDGVRLENLVALEMVGSKWLWVEAPLGDQLQKPWRRMGIDQPGRDGDVLDPKRLEMQGCWMTMDPDIGHAASRPYKLRAQLERLWDSDRFDGDVLIVESELDTVIPHPVIDNYLRAFRSAGSVQYELLARADHALSVESSRRAWTSVLMRWLTASGNANGGARRLG